MLKSVLFLPFNKLDDSFKILVLCFLYLYVNFLMIWCYTKLMRECFFITASRKFILSADQLSLTLTNLCRDNCVARSDLMVVSCNASNEYGYAYAAGYVNVLSKQLLF